MRSARASQGARTEHDVEPLYPGHSVDEVEARTGVAADVADDEVDVRVVAADGRVQHPLEMEKHTTMSAGMRWETCARLHVPARFARWR